MHESLQQFHPVIGRWFGEKVGMPTPPQVLGWPVIGAGKSCLILAPTGSGKTLAAFLAGIDWLARRMMGEGGGIADCQLPIADRRMGAVHGVQILYVSPLKSLANDVQKNLVVPLREIADVAAGMKVEWPEIEVAVRTGDTPQKARAAMARRPPHILITTPESLNLILTGGSRSMLSGVKFVIVDEVHALAGNKRGVFLSLVLERLEEERRRNDETRMTNDESNSNGRMTNEANGKRRQGKRATGVKIAPGVYVEGEAVGEMVRIGLSATARPEEVIARWLGGCDDEGKGRAVEIVRSGQRKRLDLGVVCPFGGVDEDDQGGMTNDQFPMTNDRGRGRGANEERPVKGTGHWPEVTRAVLQMIREHKSTLVFGNSRRLVERLAARFEEELERENAECEMRNAEGGSRGHTLGMLSGAPSPQSMAPGANADMQNLRRIPVIRPHHGSIAKEVRLETEQALKRGELDAVLATSSLELGIDIGALDLVVQIDSPGNVAAALQRVGRAGHLEKATAKGRLLARGLGEFGSLAALVPLMFAGTVEETHVPVNCLDVLAQQVVAACVGRPWKRGALYRVLRRAMGFATLTEKQFDSVVGMLSKRAERVTSQGLRPRLSFDRVNDELIIMPGATKVLLMNSGVISDTGAYPVMLVGRAEKTKDERRETKGDGVSGDRQLATGNRKSGPGVRIGELDEEFVYETKEGDRIVLGSQTWRVVRIDADRVLVEHASPGSSRMPFWRGESAPRSEMVGEAVGRFYGEVERRVGEMRNAEGEMRKGDGANDQFPMTNEGRHQAVMEWLGKEYHFDERAAENAVGFYRRQMLHGALPTDKRLVVEHFVDRTGEPIIAILCPLGSRVNYTLRLALEGHFARRRLPAQIVHSDDGLIIRPPVEVGEVPENPLAWLRATTLEHEIVDQLEGTSLFGLRFRQNAARALMLPRMTVTQRTPLWQQRLRARHLLALVKKERNFPIIVETYRECLQDVLGIGQVEKLLGQMERGDMQVAVVRNLGGAEPSPFSRSLFSQFQQSYLYALDDPLLPAEIEPAVDPGILDEILQRRNTARRTNDQCPMAIGWEAVDEEALRRRILGADYPARTAEELLEKIEVAGGAGVALGLADDPRWQEWVVGGADDAGRMLRELSEKRRLFLVECTGAPAGADEGKGLAMNGFGAWRWVAAENLALVIAAMGKRPVLRRFNGSGLEPAAWEELPAAILHCEAGEEDARRLMVEQAIKRRPVTTVGEIEEDLPWMGDECGMRNAECGKKVREVVGGLVRAGMVQELGEARLVWTEYAEQLRSLALRRQRRAASTVDVAALQQHILQWQHVGGALPREGVDALEDALDMLTGVALPLEFWELEVLPARVGDFVPAMLDGVCRGGHRVWVGSGDDAQLVSFWPRHLLAGRDGGRSKAGDNAGAMGEQAALSDAAQQIVEFLEKHGASFLVDMQIAMLLDDQQMAGGLEELAFAGRISNDQLDGLREAQRLAGNARHDQRPALLGRESGRYPAAVRGAGRPRRMPGSWWKQRVHGGAGQPLGGRWFLLSAPQAAQSALDATERAAERVERLLRRNGFACRELLDPELDGPWRDCYDVLTRMEWAGSVRRGYFVDGISGSQFAAPGVRLEVVGKGERQKTKDERGGGVAWLSMLDPANVWAQVNTRWVSDAGEAVRIARAPGNWIALVDGRPVLAAVNWGHRLIPLPAGQEFHERAVRALPALLERLPRLHHPHLDVRQWGEQDIVGSIADNILRSEGFTRDTQGLRLYRQYVPRAGAGPIQATERSTPQGSEGDRP